MYCIIKCIVQGKQARVKNADLRHPSCTVVMWWPATSWVHYTTSCNTQSNAPEDGKIIARNMLS